MANKKHTLTKAQARHIFARTRALQFYCSRWTRSRLSRQLAAQFSVSVKTVRDISNRRTWARVTHGMSAGPVDDLLSRAWAMQGDDPFADGMAALYAPYGREDPF